jgi:hypothetical protein
MKLMMQHFQTDFQLQKIIKKTLKPEMNFNIKRVFYPLVYIELGVAFFWRAN